MVSLIEKYNSSLRNALSSRRESTGQHSSIRALWCIFAIILALSIARCFYGLDDIDEAFNISVAIQIESGQSLFNDIRTPYQIGNISQSFVIWTFKKLTGDSNEGLVLAIRFARLMFSTLLVLSAYLILKRHFQPTCALSASTLLLFFEGYAGAHFPVLAQDYFSIYFFFLSSLLLFGAMASKDRARYRNTLLFLAGVSTALMVWHYPTALPVAFYFSIILPWMLRKEAKGILSLPTLCFVAGGLMIAGVAAIAIVPQIGTKGIQSFLETYRASHLLTRTMFDPGRMFSSISKISIAVGVVTAITVPCFLILRRRNEFRSFPAGIWFASSLIASLVVLAANKAGFISFYAGAPLMLSISGVFLPVLIAFPQKCGTRRLGLVPILLIYVPSVLFSISIASVIYMGNVKPIVGFYSSGFLFLLLAMESIAGRNGENLPDQKSNPLAYATCFVAICFSIPLWLGHYNDVPPYKASATVTSGAYKWIRTSLDKQVIVDQIEQDLQSLGSNGKTILFSGRYRVGYLLSDLKPNTPSCFSACYWESTDGLIKTDPLYVGYPEGNTGEYRWHEAFDYFSTSDLGLPDYMLLDPVEIKGSDMQTFLERHYVKVIQRPSYTIYRVKEA